MPEIYLTIINVKGTKGTRPIILKCEELADIEHSDKTLVAPRIQLCSFKELQSLDGHMAAVEAKSEQLGFIS